MKTKQHINSYNISQNKRYCDNIEYTLRQLPSWFPNSWEPNSNPNSVSGQLKNKVFKGRYGITRARQKTKW